MTWVCADCGEEKAPHKDKICRSCLNKDGVAAHDTGYRKGQADLTSKEVIHKLADWLDDNVPYMEDQIEGATYHLNNVDIVEERTRREWRKVAKELIEFIQTASKEGRK